MGKMHAEGVTLIELMVVLAVLSTVLALGVPAFREFQATNRMSAAANDLVTGIHVARSEALKRRQTVTLCASADFTSDAPTCAAGGGFEQGWLVFADQNANGAVDAGDTVVARGSPLPPDIGANSAWDNGGAGAPFYISFAPGGFPVDLPAAGTPCVRNLQLCDARGDKDVGGGIAAGRWLQLSATGRPMIFRNRADLQDAARNPLGGCP
jgi:type IV fimbrial biogenesis protein FimT